QSFSAMLLPGNASPCHDTLHLFAKGRESQHAGIAQQLSGRALINAYFRAPYLNRLINQLMQNEASENPKRVAEALTRPIADFQRRLLEQGVRDRVFRPVPPLEFYFMLAGACDHMFARRAALNHVFGVDVVTEEMKRNYARTLTSLILDGISVR
ncbi:MAG: hypothetical protein AB7E60_13855, partial [Sphingobium sp.]